MSGRYQVSGTEGEFEPGSNGLVLSNRVGIQSPDDMDELELRLLKDLYEHVLLHHFPDRVLTVADVMAVQAGCEPLDYSRWEQQKAASIGAIHAGVGGDYRPMGQFVAQAMTAAGSSGFSAPA